VTFTLACVDVESKAIGVPLKSDFISDFTATSSPRGSSLCPSRCGSPFPSPFLSSISLILSSADTSVILRVLIPNSFARESSV
jgi:hypothetical protein